MPCIDRWPSLVAVAALIAGMATSSAPVRAQEAATPSSAVPAPTGAPRVFFDCRGPQCDFTYYRTEIPWVTWVRDQRDAHVHIIMTSQQTGVGGREYLLDFMGRDPYQAYDVRRRIQSLPTDTEREALDGVALALGLGLATFASEYGFAAVTQLSDLAPGAIAPVANVVSAQDAQDPWNLWVFRVSANGNYRSQTTREERRLNAGFNASRVSPTWMQSYNANFNDRRQEIELGDGSRFIDDRYDWGFSARVVYALAPSWSVGVRSNVGRSTSNNQSIWGQVNPAVEYSFFPYEEATRRSLTAFYEIGPVYREYFEETLLGKTEELRGEQAITLEFSQRQPWGNASVRLTGSAYLHDIDLNNLRLRGNLSFRIVRGLDLNVGASYSRVRDQIFLSGGDLTDEERLLELQTQATDYEASINFGLSYQFGSIFNNVVNNRFPGGR